MSTISPGAAEQRPFISSMFAVEIDGVTVNDIMSVGGLSLDVQDIEIATVFEGEHATEYTPGLVSYSELTMKRVFRGEKDLYTWYRNIADGQDERKTGSVVVYSLDGTEVSRWNFEGAWPSKWSISDLDVGGDDPVTEEVTIQIEFLERTS